MYYHVHLRQIVNPGHHFVDGVPTPIPTGSIDMNWSRMKLYFACHVLEPNRLKLPFLPTDHDDEDKGTRMIEA